MKQLNNLLNCSLDGKARFKMTRSIWLTWLIRRRWMATSRPAME